MSSISKVIWFVLRAAAQNVHISVSKSRYYHSLLQISDRSKKFHTKT